MQDINQRLETSGDFKEEIEQIDKKIGLYHGKIDARIFGALNYFDTELQSIELTDNQFQDILNTNEIAELEDQITQDLRQLRQKIAQGETQSSEIFDEIGLAEEYSSMSIPNAISPFELIESIQETQQKYGKNAVNEAVERSFVEGMHPQDLIQYKEIHENFKNAQKKLQNIDKEFSSYDDEHQVYQTVFESKKKVYEDHQELVENLNEEIREL